MLHERIKKLLCDIIDVAYSELPQEKRDSLKWFKLYILPDEKKKSSGRYFPSKYTIEVYNASLGPEHMAKCCIHELAHHMDHRLNHVGGHGTTFYREYAKLIYASIDMGILSKSIFENDEWSRDHSKVRKIVEKYEPHPVEYTMDFPPVIKVKNAFAQKEQLKAKGYVWNNMEQVWEKEALDEEEEIETMESLGIRQAVLGEQPCKISTYSIEKYSMQVESIVYIEARGSTYNQRDRLKQDGFFFDGKKKIWICKVPSRESLDKLTALQRNLAYADKDIEFHIQNRKTKNLSKAGVKK